MMKDKIKRLSLLGMGVATSIGGMAVGLVAQAQDYSASTTAAITAAGSTVLGMFFTNLPIILGFVIAVVLTMWGIRWVIGLFRGGRKG